MCVITESDKVVWGPDTTKVTGINAGEDLGNHVRFKVSSGAYNFVRKPGRKG